MFKMNLLMCAAIVGVIASQAAARTGDSRKAAEIGEKAPGFVLTTLQGGEIKLSDYKGKIVVLEWTNHQCPVVQRYVVKQKSMQSTLASLKEKAPEAGAGRNMDVVWLAIDSSHFCREKKTDIQKYYEAQKIDYPYLLDASGKVGRRYGAKTTPHMFVIDQKGILAYAGSLDDDRYGGAENPRNYVAEAVTALLNGSTVEVSKTKPFGCSVKYKKD
ncbi:MAG: redoxin domain-containing protein [Phycisphaerae bacterium]